MRRFKTAASLRLTRGSVGSGDRAKRCLTERPAQRLFSLAEDKDETSDDAIKKIGSMRYANVRFWGSAEYLIGL
jgi:hypothetical protein